MRKCVLLLLLVTAACAPWVRVGGGYQHAEKNFSVDLPDGWMRFNNVQYLLVTRDGILLQTISIDRMKVTDSLKHTKKKLALDMLPQEAAEVIADNMNSDTNISDFILLENSPTTIAGRAGFKLVYTYKNKDGLLFKSVYCGFISEDWFYDLRYTAPARYYFDKDLGTFEKVLNSFAFIKAA